MRKILHIMFCDSCWHYDPPTGTCTEKSYKFVPTSNDLGNEHRIPEWCPLPTVESGSGEPAQNNAMPKLPKWEEVYKACFSKLPNGDLGAHALRVQAGLKAYEFIVRQLSA